MGEADEVHLTVSASGQAQVTAAGRDVHVHYGDPGAAARRAISAGAGDVECPYPGLASFDATQARWFFGRDAVTARASALAADRLRDGGPMVVVGPSGAGKSSLLRAGLLAAIAERGALPERGSASWPQLLLTPGAQPLAELASQLESVGHAQRLVIVIDQLEELFTLCQDEGVRREFIDACTALAADRALVVFGLRIDAYRHCAQYPALRQALQDGQLLVGPMSLPELRQAIEFPAREVGLDLEPGLADLMLSDLGVTEDGYEAGRLPLLGYALRATWQQRHGHVLTVDGYRTTGGIRNAVATAAERAYAALDDAGREAAPGVFSRLVRLGDDTADTRRAMALEDLAGDGAATTVVDAFTAARLLARDEAAVTITHESLLSAWPRLAQWIRTDRDELLRRQEVEEAAASWERAGHDPGLLLRGTRLEFAEQVKARLSPVGRRLHAASARQRARGRRLRAGLAAVLALLTVIATAAAVVALNQAGAARREASTAQREASTARSELSQVILADLIAEAGEQRDTGNTALAAQLDLVAYRNWHGTDLVAQEPSLYSGLVSGGSRRFTPLDPDEKSADIVTAAAFSAVSHGKYSEVL
jgi:hypothetical protein